MIGRGAFGVWCGLAAALIYAVAFTAATPAGANPCVGLDPANPYRVLGEGGQRHQLWTEAQPRTLAEIQSLNERARLIELNSRRKIMDCVEGRMSSQNRTPAKPSGTPAHVEGSSGILTDIDDAYDTLDDARAAAREYERLGYKVKWKTPNSFAVDELDYVGFSMEDPVYTPGSAEEEEALRQYLANEDNVKTVGGQQWVKNKVQPGAKIDSLNTEKAEIAERLARDDLPATERSRLNARVAEADNEIAALRQQMDDFRLTDPHGFNADMMKKGAHHMRPGTWCPPQQAFHCYEEPRQAAKAAHRVLAENLDNPTPEQQKLLDRLQSYAKKRNILPADEAAFAAESEMLRNDVRSAFTQARQQANLRESQLNQELVERYRAARAAGDTEALRDIENVMSERREAARRVQLTMEELATNDHVPNSAETVHEWTTGERVTKIEEPGKPPRFEVVVDGPNGPETKIMTADELERSSRNMIRRNAIRSRYNGPPFETRPRFSSFQSGKGRAAWDAFKTRAVPGALGALGVGYSAYQGADQAVAALDEFGEHDVPTAAEIRERGVFGLTREEYLAWAAATGLGTAIGVADATGITPSYHLGGGLYGLARRAELEAAQREGREANKWLALGRLLSPQEIGAQFAKEAAAATAQWSQQKFEEMDAALRAEIAARRAELNAEAGAEAVWARLVDGGFEQIVGSVGRLRGLTDQLRQAWRFGAAELDRAILAQDELRLLAGQAQTMPDFAGRCEALTAGLGAAPEPAAVEAARAEWQGLVDGHGEKLRKAAVAGFQTRAAAAAAAQVLGEGGLQGLVAQQVELQQSLHGSLSRLITAIDGDYTLENLREEVALQADPVPSDHVPGMVEAAADTRKTAEETLSELAAVDATARPQCAFPEAIDPAAQLAAVTAGEQALRACESEGMSDALANLETLAANLDEGGTAVLAGLRREAEAGAAFGQAVAGYREGDLPAAADHLDQARVTACPGRQTKIDELAARIERLRGVMDEITAARDSCDADRMLRLAGDLDGQSHGALVAARAGLDSAAGALMESQGRTERARAAYFAGDLDDAAAHLRAAHGHLDAIAPGACPALRRELDSRLQKIADLRQTADRAEQAIASCDAAIIEQFRTQLSDQSHPLLRAKLPRLDDAAARCEPADIGDFAGAQADCRDRHGAGAEAYRQSDGALSCRCAAGYTKSADGQRCIGIDTAAREMSDHCARQLEGGIALTFVGDGEVRCGCPDGLYLHRAGNACIDWDQAVAVAQGNCEADGGVLAAVDGPDDYTCCPGGTVTYDQDTNLCWTWDDLVADAQAACGQTGQVAVWIDGLNDYRCCPGGTTRYDQATNTCYDDAQAAAEFMQGLGDFLQAMQGRQGGGQFSGQGGVNTGSCGNFSQEAEAHSLRMQQLTAKYQASAGDTRRLQATACELFREGQRGRAMMQRYQSMGCQIPAGMLQGPDPFAAAIGENCG